MPTYLLHGFRWPRPLIRIHIILQNLDDAAAEWLMAPATAVCMRDNFRKLHPKLLAALPDLQFIEQFDEELALSPGANVQPYAYVADAVEEIKLGVVVDEIAGRGVGDEAAAAMAELRDSIAPGEKLGWFVVVCQDTERWAPPADDEDEAEAEESVDEELEEEMRVMMLANANGNAHENGHAHEHGHGHANANANGNGNAHRQGPAKLQRKNSPNLSRGAKGGSASSTTPRESIERPSTSRSVKKWFGGLGGQLRKAKSLKDLRKLETEKAKEMAMPPPLPGTAA